MRTQLKELVPITKEHMIDVIADDLGLSKAGAERALDKVFGLVVEELDDGGSVRIPGFGTFSVRRRNARQGRNPATQEPITIPAQNVVHFSVSEKLKKRINV